MARFLVHVGVALVLLAPAVSGQQGRVEARATAGAVQKYLDTGFPDHWGAGGSVRFYFSERVALEPEVFYARSRWSDFVQERRLVVQPNLVYDFRAGARTMLYLIGGLGYEHFRGIRPLPSFSDSRLTGSGGIGARIHLTERLYVSPEVRAPVFRVTGSVGWVLRLR